MREFNFYSWPLSQQHCGWLLDQITWNICMLKLQPWACVSVQFYRPSNTQRRREIASAKICRLLRPLPLRLTALFEGRVTWRKWNFRHLASSPPWQPPPPSHLNALYISANRDCIGRLSFSKLNEWQNWTWILYVQNTFHIDPQKIRGRHNYLLLLLLLLYCV